MTYWTAGPRLARWKAWLGVAVAAGALLAFTANAGAAVLTPAPDNSTGSDNLTAAINTANSNSDPSNTIILSRGLYRPTGPGLPTITKSLRITDDHSLQGANNNPEVQLDGSAVSNPNTDFITIAATGPSGAVHVQMDGFDISTASNLGFSAIHQLGGTLTMYGMLLTGEGGLPLTTEPGSTTTLNYSTIDGATETAGLSESNTNLTLNNSDIVNNASGGLSISGGNVTLNNSLLVNNNVAALGTSDCNAHATVQHNSMDDDGSCGVTFSNEQFWNLTGGFPGGTTQGGPEPSYDPGPGAPTAGAGNPSFCQTVDSRFFVVPTGSCDVGSFDHNATQDFTPGTCVVTNLIAGPPKQQQVTVSDPIVGLGPEGGAITDPAGTPADNVADAVTGLSITNGSVANQPFADPDNSPSKSGVVLTATKADQSQLTTWSFTLTNWAGVSKFCK